MKCLNCGKESKTKFCNGKCRSVDYRARTSARPETGAHGAHGETSAQMGQNIPPQGDGTKKDVPKLSPSIASGQANTKLPLNFGLDNCERKHCQSLKMNGISGKLNHGARMSAANLSASGYRFNRVIMPGDVDYMPNDYSDEHRLPITEPERQEYIHARNAATRERRRLIPMKELISTSAFIPNWRIEQEKKFNVVR